MSQSSNAGAGTAFPTKTRYSVSLPIDSDVLDQHHAIAADQGTDMDTVIAGLLAEWFAANGGDVNQYPEEVRP